MTADSRFPDLHSLTRLVRRTRASGQDVGLDLPHVLHAPGREVDVGERVSAHDQAAEPST